jgi:regulatory protein
VSVAAPDPIPAAGGTITGLHVQRRNPDRANLHIDGTFCCGVAYEVVYAERLHTGEPISRDAVARIRAADEQWRARHAALSLLAVRPRARRELSDRLKRKQFPPAAVEWAVTEADRLGLLDDRAFAESWVRDRLKLKPRGSRALVAELMHKGVDRETASRAVARVLQTEQADEATLCLHSAQKWLRTHGRSADAGDADQRRRVQRRLVAFLQRRGYAPDHIRAALDAARPFSSAP